MKTRQRLSVLRGAVHQGRRRGRRRRGVRPARLPEEAERHRPARHLARVEQRHERRAQAVREVPGVPEGRARREGHCRDGRAILRGDGRAVAVDEVRGRRPDSERRRRDRLRRQRRSREKAARHAREGRRDRRQEQDQERAGAGARARQRPEGAREVRGPGAIRASQGRRRSRRTRRTRFSRGRAAISWIGCRSPSRFRRPDRRGAARPQSAAPAAGRPADRRHLQRRAVGRAQPAQLLDLLPDEGACGRGRARRRQRRAARLEKACARICGCTWSATASAGGS